jgi:hypothetical protein
MESQHRQLLGITPSRRQPSRVRHHVQKKNTATNAAHTCTCIHEACAIVPVRQRLVVRSFAPGPPHGGRHRSSHFTLRRCGAAHVTTASHIPSDAFRAGACGVAGESFALLRPHAVAAATPRVDAERSRHAQLGCEHRTHWPSLRGHASTNHGHRYACKYPTRFPARVPDIAAP